MSISQLSDKEIIKNLEAETWLSEIMARNLQSMSTGAATLENFEELIHWEAKTIKGIQVPNLDLNLIKEIKLEFEELCLQWDSIQENERLQLTF